MTSNGQESGLSLKFGERMVRAGLLTKEQCSQLLIRQENLLAQQHKVRLGSLAVERGYCSQSDIDALPGFIGERMVQAGLLTRSQQRLLLKWQSKLRARGVDVRYGELGITEGFCAEEEVESLMSATMH